METFTQKFNLIAEHNNKRTIRQNAIRKNEDGIPPNLERVAELQSHNMWAQKRPQWLPLSSVSFLKKLAQYLKSKTPFLKEPSVTHICELSHPPTFK